MTKRAQNKSALFIICLHAKPAYAPVLHRLFLRSGQQPIYSHARILSAYTQTSAVLSQTAFSLIRVNMNIIFSAESLHPSISYLNKISPEKSVFFPIKARTRYQPKQFPGICFLKYHIQESMSITQRQIFFFTFFHGAFRRFSPNKRLPASGTVSPGKVPPEEDRPEGKPRLPE